MEVAQHPGLRAAGQWQEQLLPVRSKSVALNIVDFNTEFWEVPVKQQLGFDQESLHIVMRELVVTTRRDRHDCWKCIAVHLGEEVDCRLIAGFDWCRWIAFDK